MSTHLNWVRHGWRPCCIHRICAPNSFFTIRDKSPKTSLHWDSTCGTLIRWVKNSLVRHLWWIEHVTKIAKKTFPCLPDKFHVSSGMLRSRLNIDRGLWTTAGWLGTWDNFPLPIDSTSWNSSESWIQFTLSCKSCICEARSCSAAWLSLTFMHREFVNSHFLNTPQFFHFMDVSDTSISKCSLSLRANSCCNRTCSLRDSSYPQFTSSNSNSWEWALSLKFTNASVKRIHFTFLLHDFGFRFRKRVIPVTLQNRFHRSFRIRELNKGSLFPKTCWCLERKIFSMRERFWIQPVFAWKQQRTGSCRILRWTGHQVFSYRVMN